MLIAKAYTELLIAMAEAFDLHEIILPSGGKVTFLIPVPLSEADKAHLSKMTQGLIELTIEHLQPTELHHTPVCK